MSKKKNARPSELEFERDGYKIILRGMPPLVPERVASSVEMPEVPTYEVETADGSIEVWEHDETTLTTPEDHEAWNKYQKKLAEAETLVTERLLRAILLESVEVEVDSDTLERFRRRQELIGLEPPKDEEELLLYFKETMVLRTTEDVQDLLDVVLELTGVSRKEIDALKASFPDNVESDTSADAGDEA